MGNFRYRMIQFMMGRNGFDNMCRGLLFASVILIVADMFIPGNITRSLGLVILLYAYYRAFSRNLARRRAENEWFILRIESPLTSYLNRDRKNYRYFKCPCCGQTLRAPKGRGRIRVTCSRCGNVFERKV